MTPGKIHLKVLIQYSPMKGPMVSTSLPTSVKSPVILIVATTIWMM